MLFMLLRIQQFAPFYSLVSCEFTLRIYMEIVSIIRIRIARYNENISRLLLLNFFSTVCWSAFSVVARIR